MLHLLLSTDWTAERREILHRIARDVRQEQGGRILIVPELISHDTERRLSAAAGDTASRFAEVLSFSRMVRRVSDSMGCPAPECMDAGGRLVAMAAAARQLHSRLKAYAAVQTKPEFLSDLVEAVDEFKRCCISAQDLQTASARSQGTLAQKLEELSLLLQGYDSLCAQGRRDPRDQMNWLLEQLEEGDFAQTHTFYIDGFPDLTRQHLAILEYLIQASPSVTVGLNCDAPGSEKMAFQKAGATAAELIRCAKRAGVEVRIERIPGAQTPLQRVCHSLFQGPLPTDMSHVLRVFKAENQWAEAEVAAQEVMDLVRGGCRYRDVGIVCADMAAYADILQLIFHRCGIPIYQSGTEDILQKTVVSTVLSALEAALGGLEREDVLRYLRSALSPLEPELCDRVDNYAVIWSIRGKQWQTEWKNHPEGLSETWTPATQSRLDRLNEAKDRALAPLFRLRDGFLAAKDLAGQVWVLYAFLEEICLAQRLDKLADSMDAAGDNRSAQILDQLWEILLTALEQLHDVLGKTVWEPEAFVRLLTLLLSQYDVGTIPPVLDAVTVGPVSAMRCQEQKHLIVLGAEEGKLPGYGGSRGLLSDGERTALRAMGMPLTGGSVEGLQAEFAEISGVFQGAGQSVAVIFSGQGSYICSRLADMAGGVRPASAADVMAQTNAAEAGAFLARFRAAEAARELGVERDYAHTAAQADHALGTVRPENVRALYGSKLTLSASQVDRQAECRFSYFLKYGLRAKERREARIDPAEFGTYVHAVLEHTARQVMSLGGFGQVSLEQTMDIALAFSEEYAAAHFRQIDSARLTYLFRRNRRELEMVVAELWQELHSAEFRPVEFELSFGGDGKMPAISIPSRLLEAELLGFVDRVDIWQEHGNHYFRVVDYKTGKKDFDYCDVYNGVGLQMLLYLFALEQGGAAVVVGEKPLAAGVQYFPARAPLLSVHGAMTEETAARERLGQWKRRGLLLADEQVLRAMDPEESVRLCCTRKKDGTLVGDLATREQLKLLKTYIFSWLGDMVDTIAGGDVTPDPYTRGTIHNACAYCPYGPVCHKAAVEGRRNYKAMEPERFWEEVEKEVRRHGS